MIDIFPFPDITGAKRSERATTFGDPSKPSAATSRQRKAQKAAKKAAPPVMSHKADPATVASLLSALVDAVDGRNVASMIPMVQGLLSDRLGIAVGGEFADSFGGRLHTVVGELGRTVQAPRARGEPAPDVVQVKARSMGVRNTPVRRTTPRLVAKFDETSAAFSDGVTLQAVLSDGADGLPIGAAEVINSAVVAIRNAFVMGDPGAARVAAEEMGVLLVALDSVVNGASRDEPAQRSARQPRMRRVGPNHWLAEGYEPIRRRANEVVGIVIDGETVPTDEVEFKGGRPVRKRTRRGS